MTSQRFSGMVLAVLALVACSRHEPPPESPRPVATLVVAQGADAHHQSFSGDVRARHETALGFRIGGKIAERLVDVGAEVKKGQPLARLDPADVSLQAAQASAQLAQAETDIKRWRELRGKNFISQWALETHETELKTVRAQAGIARNQAEYATLRADAPGVIAAVMAEPGQVVAAGAPVVALAREGEREVAISIPESSVARYRIGDSAEVRLWANDAKSYHGRIREITPAADPATRSYQARVTLADADARVALGMTAQVTFRRNDENGIVVPAAAIYQQGEQPAVWVVDGKSTAHLRPVKVAAWRDGGAAVAAGLVPGERIVASGVHKVQDGEKVAFKDIPR